MEINIDCNLSGIVLMFLLLLDLLRVVQQGPVGLSSPKFENISHFPNTSTSCIWVVLSLMFLGLLSPEPILN